MRKHRRNRSSPTVAAGAAAPRVDSSCFWTGVTSITSPSARRDESHAALAVCVLGRRPVHQIRSIASPHPRLK
jgi:hypothetical protein